MVAETLGFTYLDTGAMYRAFAFYLLSLSLPIEEISLTEEVYLGFHFEIQEGNGGKIYVVNGQDITNRLRTKEVTKASSEIAGCASLRFFMTKLQREYAKGKKIVVEGRDMGSTVFAQSECKIYLTASEKVRAKRRYEQLLSKEGEADFEAVLREQRERDLRDSTREASPLVCPIDAYVIDTDEMGANQVVAKIVKIASSQRHQKPHWMYRSFLMFIRFLFRLLYKVEIYGTENLQKGPAIFAANHTSFFDPPLVGAFSYHNVHFLARATLFDHFLFGNLIGRLQAHPIHGGASDIELFEKVDHIFSLGGQFVMFPEGKRSRDGNMLPFKRGIGYLVYKSCPIIYPVYVQGAYEVWSRNRKLPKLFKKIAVVYGKPMRFFKEEGVEAKAFQLSVTKQIEEAVKALKSWLEKGGKEPFPENSTAIHSGANNPL